MLSMESLIEKYGAFIYNYAYKLACHPIDAEDLAQETFINAWRNLDSLQSEEAVRSWLAKICYHQFLMKMRQKNKHKEELTDEFTVLEQEGMLLQEIFPAPEEEVIVEEEIKELQNGCFYAMVRRLTLQQRIVFSLTDMYGMKIEEVAGILQTSIPAAKGLLYRARMNIDSFFAGHCGIINSKNPCRCKAWLKFSGDRNELQKRTRHAMELLNYKSKSYQYSSEIRRKIAYLYKNMPDKKPDEEWYRKIENILGE